MIESKQLELEMTGSESPSPPGRFEEDGSIRRASGQPVGADNGTVGSARERQRTERKTDLPRLALTFAESAAMLGVSDEFFAQHVAGELRFVRRGRKKLVALRELERWLAESAARELN